MKSLATANVAYLSTDPGISAGGTKGAAQHVREISETLARRARRCTLAIERRDGPEPLPTLPLTTPGELLASVTASGAEPLDLLIERYALSDDRGRAIARASGARHWLEVNAPLIEEAQAHRGLDAAAAAKERERLRELLQSVDGVLCVSPPLVRWCVDHGADAARVHLFRNGFCQRRFAHLPSRQEARLPLRLAPAAFVAIFAGGFRPWHDLPTLIDAFEQLRVTHPGARLVLAGDGPERRKLDATRLACLDVLDLGHVPARALPSVLAAADVGIAPNRASGGDWFCPLKIAEYQAAGLAVVATEGTGGHAPLDHDRTGVLVPAGNHKALTAALRRLADDAPWCIRLATAGQAQARALHSWDRRVDELERWWHGPASDAALAAGGVA